MGGVFTVDERQATLQNVV